VHDQPKLSPTEAGSLNNSALAPTPVHEQKRRLRSARNATALAPTSMDARNATGADQASLVEPSSPMIDAFSAYRSAYDGSLSIELTESQIDEANASRTGHPPPPFNTTQGNHSANEKARVLGPLLKDVEQKQGFIAVCFAVAALILSSCCFFAWYVGSNRAGDEKDNELCPGTPQAATKTHANLLTAMKCADGSWAQNYEAADEKRKAALELLFRCNIVRVQEFAHSRVNQEHVDECVWIAMHMLRKKPLEEWVEHWEEARQTFEDGVTACFQARTATKDALSDTTSPESPSSPFRMGDYARQCSAEEALMSRDSTGENILAQRCREIMSQSRQRNTPRESRSGFRTIEPPDNRPRSRPATPRSDRSPRSAPTSQADLRAAPGSPPVPPASKEGSSATRPK